MNRKTFLVSAVAALFFAAAQAEITLPSIFSDNMLLQRGAPVKIWGKADAGAKVEVAFAGQKKSTKAGADGKWSVFLDKMQADKTPREMTVSENGKVSKTVKNILVGEVWIAGGQSNMGFTLKNCDDAKKHIAASANPLIRYFSQNTASMSKKPREDSLNGKWTECAPEASPNYSGVAYFFAR
ncbi:MAG: acetyl esterase, partial [Opitutales bacterium]|nr:acetyl esterase [Opitutales bacterium]